MKQVLSYAAAIVALAALGRMPFRGTDVAKLEPVEVIRVTMEQGEVLLQADTGAGGRGEDVETALLDMAQTTAGEVFLETADYLMVSPDAVSLLPALCGYLRPACNVCVAEGEIAPEEAGVFLAVHKPGVSLIRWRAEACALPVLKNEEGEMRLVEG